MEMKSKNIFSGRYGHVLMGFLVGVGIVLFLVVYNLLAAGASDDDQADQEKTQDKARDIGPDTADIVGDYFFRTGKMKAKAKPEETDPEHEETVRLEDVATDAGEDVASETSRSDPSPVASSAQSQQSSATTTQSKTSTQQSSTQAKQQPQAKAQTQRKQENKVHPTIEKLEN